MENKIEIQLSNTKIFFLLIGAIAFVIFGTLFFLNPDNFQSTVFTSLQVIRIGGLVCALFFGMCTIFIARKLYDKKVGLTIDQNGITDNSNAMNIGLVEWADITNIRTIKVVSTKILMLDTDKPEKYIERAKNILSKRSMKTNYKMYGSPITIVSNSLKIKYDDLEKLIREEFNRREK